MSRIKLKIDGSIFNGVYLKNLLKNDFRYQIVYGGSSSGKSVAIAQRVVLDVFKGDRNYLIVRNTQTTLKRSVLNEVVKAIGTFELGDYFKLNKSDNTITCLLNNRQIIFCGLDDPEKIKSITPISGVITDVWMEEATECDYKAYKQLDKRLRGLSKVNKRMVLSFNPVLKEHWIYKEFFEGVWLEDDKYNVDEENKTSILKTTYKDNKFLTKDDILALEDETDKYYYEVYTLGNWGVLGSLVFTNWVVEDFSELEKTFDSYINGVDWGYSVDPFAFVRSHYDKKRNILYICEEIYAIELSNKESAKLVKKIVGDEEVVCDSSETKSVDDYIRYKVRAIGAKKGPGSVEHGIKFIQSMKVKIHPRCIHAASEFSKYTWKEDRYGNKLPVANDKDNHLIDALRYSLEGVNEKKRRGIIHVG